MKVDEQEFINSLANDETAIGVTVSISRGAQDFDAFFVTDNISEEFGRVAGTMLSALSMLKNADGSPAIDPLELEALKKVWRGLVHG